MRPRRSMRSRLTAKRPSRVTNAPVSSMVKSGSRPRSRRRAVHSTSISHDSPQFVGIVSSRSGRRRVASSSFRSLFSSPITSLASSLREVRYVLAPRTPRALEELPHERLAGRLVHEEGRVVLVLGETNHVLGSLSVGLALVILFPHPAEVLYACVAEDHELLTARRA